MLGIIIILIYTCVYAQPTQFKLYQNNPNPFDTSGTEIRFDIPILSFNRLWIEDTVGNQVKTLVSSQYQPGYMVVFWNGRNENGMLVPTGTYVCKMLSTSDGDTLFRDSIQMEFQLVLQPPFTDISAQLQGVFNSSVAWGDYDNDGDLDLLLTGVTDTLPRSISRIYRNDNGNFVPIEAGLLSLEFSSVTWGDYDNDGDLDILLTGWDVGRAITKIYRNDNPAQAQFVDIHADLAGAYRGSAGWGDYDNDGDLDILLTGEEDNKAIGPKIYRNDRGNFIDINISLVPFGVSSAAWGDYDNDGDLDILLAGEDRFSTEQTKIFRNDNGKFIDVNATLDGVSYGSVAWGDYDSDGDLDILLTGVFKTKIYRNDDGSFDEINPGLTDVFGSASWGDYDNDGDLDILLTGDSYVGRISKVYRNDGNFFVEIKTTITGIKQGSAAWGDYDNDGDLDILLTGMDSQFNIISKIYQNNIQIANTVPTSPTNLKSSVSGSSVVVSWERSFDNQTDPNSLTYNLRIGTTTDGVQIVSPMADLVTGFHKIPMMGNVNHNNNWTIKNLPDGNYYWSVQAIDHGFAGSQFATVQSFVIDEPAAPQNLIVIPGKNHVRLSWDNNIESDFLRYRIYGGSSPNPITAIDSTNNIADTTIVITGLINGTKYYFRLTAVDSSYNESDFSNEVSATPLAEAFSEINASLIGVNHGSVAWGDYDNDGDLDILLTGTDGSYNSGVPYAKVYRNDNGNFIDINAPIAGVRNSAVAWGDYDNDNDLDILLTGHSNSDSPISKIYRNDEGKFTDINALLIGVEKGSVDWGDYDNDGDLDILLAGAVDASTEITIVYRNDGARFVDISAGLSGVWWSSVTWGDYDNDGALDILLAGTSNFFFISKLYRNESGRFVETNNFINGVGGSSVTWGDYDSDGDLDFLLTGDDNLGNRVAEIYRNDSGRFIKIDAGLTGVSFGSVAWGDYDNDGDLDILLTGSNPDSGYISKIYRNEDGAFVNIQAALIGVGYSSVAWGDYDNDGDLDILLTGRDRTGRISKIYRNNISTSNIVPTAPTNLVSSVRGSSVTLNWDRSTDAQTHQNSLTYNLWMSTIPNGGNIDIVSPMADTTTGYRRVPKSGNTCHRNSSTIKNLPDETYYWSVQAIDNAFAGSVFSAKGSFTINTTAVKSDDNLLPDEYVLHQNFPNPFNPTTTIKYQLPKTDRVRLIIYDLLGIRVCTLINEEQAVGYHSIQWDGRDDFGLTMPSGMYIYRLETSEFTQAKKMLLLK